MRFQNQTNSQWIKDCSDYVNILLMTNSGLWKEIFQKSDWKFDNIQNGAEVANKLLKGPGKAISIFTYKPLNPWTKALGYFDGKDIHINIRAMKVLKDAELVGLLLHEYAHACGFTHGNNYKTKEKCLYSVPYYLSENVSKWL